MPLLAAPKGGRRPLLVAGLLILVLGAHAGHGTEGHGTPEESGHGAEGEHGSLEASGSHGAPSAEGHGAPSDEGHGAPSEHGSSGGGEHGAAPSEHGGQSSEHGGQSSEHGGQSSEHGGQSSEHGGQSAGGQHGGGDGGKAGHGGGGHHVVKVSAQERSIAYLMMFAVAAEMVLLFFLNYSDPDVRCASSKMACTAISVYCAVLLNQAIFSCIFEQLLVGEGGRGFGMKPEEIKPWMHVVIGGMIFVPMLAGLNYMCWRHQHHPNRLVVSSQLGAHMVAWAGINTFGSLQASEGFHRELLADITLVFGKSRRVKEHQMVIKYIFVVVIGFLTFTFLFGLSKYIRTKVLERVATKRGYTLVGGGKREVKMAEAKSGSEAPEGNGAAGGGDEKKGEATPGKSKTLERVATKASSKSKKEEPEEEEHWLEELGEGEREAMALVLGFLTQQTIVYIITGKVVIPIHGLHDHRKVREVILMCASAMMTFVILLWVAVIHRKPGKSIFNFRGYLAMTMAWLFERSGEWYMHRFFTLPFARIWSAFILTGFAIFATVAIDKFADNTSDRKRRSKLRETVELEELVALDKYYELKERQKQAARLHTCEPVADSEEAPVPDSQLAEPDMINGVPCSRLAILHRDLRDETPTDVSVQTLTVGFSVLIGIVWDMAFESAEGLIVAEGNATVPEGQSALPVSNLQEWFSEHPVIGKNMLAFILCAFVLPGWIYYIVPPARKAWRHHLEDILLEQRQVPRTHHRQNHTEHDIETH